MEPPLQVETWNRESRDLTFGLPPGWRCMTAEEAAAHGAGRTDVRAGALSVQRAPDLATVALMAAIRVSPGPIDEAIRAPDRLVAARQPAGARLVSGPQRLAVAGGRGLLIEFEEVVPAELYGSDSPTTQARVEAAFEGIGSVWVFQLISPADAVASHIPAYETALGTWLWTRG